MTFSAHHWPQCAKVPFSQNMKVYARQKVTTFKAHKESLNFFPKGVGVGGKLLTRLKVWSPFCVNYQVSPQSFFLLGNTSKKEES